MPRRSGIAIGKFHPPHAGHAYLIDVARASVDHLYVVVCEKPGQPISGALRARWLREIHPDVDVRVVPDVVGDDDSAGWADYTRAYLGRAPDVVFSSEDYGDAYAKHLGATHVCVDRKRERIPISATLVRSDPTRYADYLAPCVRAYFARRVAFVGAESTGKSTLCQRLSQHFGAPWVAEYGREYSLAKYRISGMDPNAWRDDEFAHIAREQQRREDAAARNARGLLLCDTDAFATQIWRERYLREGGNDVPGIGPGWPARDRAIDLYLVPDPSVPFVQDGIRDGEAIRTWMHERFLERLRARRATFEVLIGSYDERREQAARAIDVMLAQDAGGTIA